MKIIKLFSLFTLALVLITCSNNIENPIDKIEDDNFKYFSEKFADLKILRYKIPGFDELDVKKKTQLYYLYEAALSGNEIIWDQNYKHNLLVKRSLENIVNTFSGDKTSSNYNEFLIYVKRMWFSNGIHHHYSAKKFEPTFTKKYLKELIVNSEKVNFPLEPNQSFDELTIKLTDIIFNPSIAPKRINLNSNDDMISTSANNFYENITQKEVEQFYKNKIGSKNAEPISFGLNSRLIKKNGQIREHVWKLGGMYSASIEKIIYWLEQATTVAENELQKKTLELLIEYYKTGDLKKFDEYNIAWVKDTESLVDVVNGFIEVYGDPLGYRGAYESVVSFKDFEATKRIKAISDNAQWFEDNSPLMESHKKKSVKGISAKVITVVVEAGDASPSTPIGINLPNSNWIRAKHGSKSVNLGNIVFAYSQAKGGALKEFAYSEKEIELSKKYGALASDLHTDMHEVIGHASGQINPGIGTPKETLKNYSNTLEEARADLVALYYQLDPKLVEIGVMPNTDVGKAEYNGYIRNSLLVQLARLEPNADLEEAHMRNRQLNALWAYEKGKSKNVIEKKFENGKTYFVINDYNKLREIFGQLLREIQRIKSEGDYDAGKKLVETYGVKVDKKLHKEVLARYKKLNVSPYGGFIQPRLVPVVEDGIITNVKVEYPDSFEKQMLEYAGKYNYLPTSN
ncbi:MAG: dihydrofolate reductase [Melioribacteraceae bacterium]